MKSRSKQIKINGNGVEHSNLSGYSSNHANLKEEYPSELTSKYQLRERTKISVKYEESE